MNEYEIGITGGSGFIGSYLARHLSKRFRIRLIDIKPVQKELESRVSFQKCDIRNYDEVKEKLENVDLVIHSAIVQIPLINEVKRLGYEVNLIGTQNVCEVVYRTQSIKGLILTGTWHVFGERELQGTIDEEFGFRPDKIEDRARLYALSKITQETIVRFYDEMSEKIFGVVRMGTVLGEGMPDMTAANIFISKGLKGKAITPYRHSMHRPMLYVDVKDVCKAFEIYDKKILNKEAGERRNSLYHIINLSWPEPITIFELAHMVRDSIMKHSRGKINPKIEIIDKRKPLLYNSEDKNLIKVEVSKAKKFLRLESLTNPKQSIERIVKERVEALK